MIVGRAAGVTDTGRRRRRNEDAFVCDPPLFAIADGMGGAQAGELASRLAAAAIEEAGAAIGDEEGVAGAVRTANARIFERSLTDPAVAGMGTTATVALVDEHAATLTLAHVGDSRAYRYRNGELEQLTTDHSLVAELVRTGRLTEAEAAVHPHRSVITRALGTEAEVEVDTRTLDVVAGDLVLLCSDGLSAMVRHDEIARLLEESDLDPYLAAETLVRAANAAGGEDNVTVVVLELIEGTPRAVSPAPAETGTEAGPDDVDLRVGARRRATARSGQGEPMAGAPLRPRDPRRRGACALVELPAVSARNRELATLLLAGLVASTAFASAWISGLATIDYGWLPWAALLGGIFLIAHVVARWTVPDADPTLLPLVALISAIGLVFVYRIEPQDGRRQLVWIAVGVAAFAFVLVWLRYDYRVLERYKYVFGVSAIVLLMLPSVPGLGQRVNGVKLWVDVGPLRFQPGEIAKIFLVIFLAGYLRDKREALARGRLKDFGPLLAIWGAAMLVLVQTSDLGSALLNFGIFLAMVYAATGRVSYVLAGLALFAGGSALLYDSLGRVQQRVTVWLQPWTDEKVHCSVNGLLEYRQNCDSYQLVKSLYSIANGGYGGTGIGRGTFETVDGTPLIPYLQTDFVYSAIAQELGLIGAAAVLLLFLALVARGMRVALVAHDGFSKLLAAGLTFGFALQTFIIVGGVLRLVPLTGITLPFVSYGGSSVVSNFVMLALLLLVSHRAVRTAPT